MSQFAAQSPALRPNILVVDDDSRLRDLLRRYLSEHGMLVSTASDAAEARVILRNFAYDLMVLDVMMPGESGIDLMRSLRMGTPPQARGMPVLLLTARGEPRDRIEGFESGADDYLAKPFEPRELLLRISAILRRAAKPAVMPELKLGRWTYNPQRDELSCENETIRLTDMEAGLMRVLAAEPCAPVSREALAERAGYGKGEINDRTIDVQIARLRRKIEEDTKTPRYIVTVRGEGYMLMPDVNSQ